MTRRVGVPALLIAIGTVLTLLGITPALASGAPVIRSFRASQSSIAGSGGRIILSIEVGAADRCALTSTPAVRGLPKMISCRTGAAKIAFVIPSNPGRARTFKIVLAAMSGTLKVERSLRVAQAEHGQILVWGRPERLDSQRGGLASVSCPRPNFCMAIGGDVAYEYDGSRWSGPMPLVPRPRTFNSVSCVSRSFCVAVGGMWDTVFNGTHWSHPKVATVKDLCGCFGPVSCATNTFCLALDGPSAYSYNGAAWSEMENVDPQNFSDLSCTSSSFCLAVDENGNALTYDGSSWSAAIDIDAERGLTSVSCSTAAFCVAMDDLGNAAIYDGKAWTGAKAKDPRLVGLSWISCSSRSFCVAVGIYGRAVTFDGRTWSDPAKVGQNGLVAVSCPSRTFCVAVDGQGQAVLGN